MIHDIDLEQSLLGTLLFHPTMIDEHGLTDELFHHSTAKKIFNTVRDEHILGNTIDPLSIANKLPDHKPAVQKCSSLFINATYAKQHIKVLRSLAFRRRIVETADTLKLIAEAPEVDSAALDEAQRVLLAQHQPKRAIPLSEAITNTISMAEEIQAGGAAGLESKIKAVDDLLGGFHKQDLIIIAARPGVGKTALATGIGHHVAKTGHVDLFSLEMSSQQIAQRLICGEAGVSSYSMRTGTLRDDDWVKIVNAETEMNNLDMTIHDDPIQNVLDLRSACRRTKPILIIVDYLQLMTGVTDYRNRNQEVSEISRSLKALAKEFDVPVIALSQLSRGTEKEGKEPRLSDLRDSGAIEQDADIVMFLHRQKTEEKEFASKIQPTDLIVAKHRHGPIGRKRVSFNTSLAKFGDVY